MTAGLSLGLRYAAFALLATAANIAAQDLVVCCYSGPYALFLSLCVGTAVGLVIKYWLDKRYIFVFRTRDLGHDSRIFLLYSLMGLATTAIFWGFELAFHWLFENKTMRYVGGVIGLAIGYVVKYLLDKRFVFC